MKYHKIPTKTIILYLSLSAAIICIASIEALVSVRNFAVASGSKSNLVDGYVSAALMRLSYIIIIPIILSIYSYIAYTKFGSSALLKVVMVFSILLHAAGIVFEVRHGSGIWFVYLILDIALIIITLSFREY